MNRRDFFKAITALVPAATVRLEPGRGETIAVEAFSRNYFANGILTPREVRAREGRWDAIATGASTA